MSWPSDARTAPFLLRLAARRSGHPVHPPSQLAGWKADDRAMFFYTARCHAPDPTATDRVCQRWIDTLMAHPAHERVWVPHRGAILYLLECAALAPMAWQGAEHAIELLLDLAVYEASVATPLRNGVSFLVVETLADELSVALADHSGEALHPRLTTLGDLAADLRADWARASRRAAGVRAELRRTAAPALGVPFESACPLPRPSADRRFAEAFRADAHQDVTLYDSAPLDVAVVALIREHQGLLPASPPNPRAAVRWAHDHALRELPC